MPSQEQCATGAYNGYWEGGSTERFVVCVGAAGTPLVYLGGTVAPICGTIVVGGQSVAPGDPNACPLPGSHEDTLTERARALGLNYCSAGKFAKDASITFTSCVGEFESHDGVEIDARLTFPSGATGNLPLVTQLHGWSGDRRGPWQDAANDDPTGWGRARFIARGYATLVTTARGFWASCGTTDQVNDHETLTETTDGLYGPMQPPVTAAGGASGGTDAHEEDPTQCLDGYTHIAEPEFEGLDTKHLLGKLVDSGIADPERLVAVGDSYGAGQVWQLATSEPWSTPSGEREISLAAALPMWGWTDLEDALLPNGRATDGIPVDDGPAGVLKQSMFSHLFRLGRVRIPGMETPRYVSVEQGRYNTHKPAELHSFIDGWMAVWTAGEPYRVAADEIAAELDGKSALFADRYFDALRSHAIKPVPIFTVQGWTDPLFPAVQSLQMLRKLKDADPNYPITVVLGNHGHGSVSQDHMDQMYEAAGAFVDAHLLGNGGGPRSPAVASFETDCGNGDQGPLSAHRWDDLTRHAVTFSAAESRQTSSLDGVDPEDAATDTVVAAFTGTTANCLTQKPSQSAARWSWDVESDLQLVGLPRVTVPYSLTGTDATVVAKLWEVAGDRRNLVTRGVYRLRATSPQSSGEISFQLFGNHYTFREGTMIELELDQSDAPFFRPNNLPSSIDFGGAELVIPGPQANAGWPRR